MSMLGSDFITILFPKKPFFYAQSHYLLDSLSFFIVDMPGYNYFRAALTGSGVHEFLSSRTRPAKTNLHLLSAKSFTVQGSTSETAWVSSIPSFGEGNSSGN